MGYNQVNISSGHSINCQGARDIINEVTEARKVVDRVYEIIKASGKQCYKYHDTSSSSTQNLVNIVNWHNGFNDGVDVSIHFNAYAHVDKPMGTEVCYYSNSSLAAAVSKEIATAGGFIDRGAKQRTGLYFLKHTNKPAILIEVCFVDSVADVELYKKNFDAICNSIVKAITGKSLDVKQEESKNETPVEVTKHLIISKPTATKEQMQKWVKTKNEKCLIPASLLWDMSLQYGIDPVVTIAQFCWETDFIYRNGKSNAGLNESYHNPCGLKITSGGSDTDPNAHMKFPTWCHGFTAYLDHLALYLGIEGYPTNITLDPRHFPYLKGTAKYVEDLSGKWCPNQSYATNIIRYMNEIKSIQ